MIILTIRTDSPEAEIGLFDGSNKLAYKTWQAHRQLAETIHEQIKHLLSDQKLDWQNIRAIVCYKGPGSFTGLRIGLSVGNALAYGLNVPIVGTMDEDWIETGQALIGSDKDEKIIIPEYGAPVNITKPKK